MVSLSDWKGIGASVVGSDHLRRELPLQDASAAVQSPRPAAVVCDGAGSAKKSHDGANAAVREFRIALAALEPLLRDCLDDPRTPGAFAESLWHYAASWLCRALVAARDEAARMGTGDPLDQISTVGWKMDGFGVKLIQPEYAVRIECGIR